MYPPISPVIQIGPLALHWYGVIMAVAIAIGALVASRYLTRRGQDGNEVWSMLLWVLIPAIIGERLYYVFIQSPRDSTGLGGYLANPITILEIWNGGLHIYGAFIFGGIALALYIYFRKLSLPIFFDAVALGLLLGQAIGRWANFINQELYGPPTTLPWGLRIDAQHRLSPYNDLTKYPNSVRFHPLFLYESLGNFIGFGLIFWISRRFEKRLRTGDVFLLYLIWYLSLRFCIEFLRTDSWFFPGTPFNVVHLISFLAVTTAITLLIVRHWPKKVLALQGADGGGDIGGAEVTESTEISASTSDEIATEVEDKAAVPPASASKEEANVTEQRSTEPASMQADGT